jgi:glycosyltransferase involved in cell wall biosynthesis
MVVIGKDNMLTVVIPIYNALDHVKSTLHSVINTTQNLSEIVLVDDHSDEETRLFIDGLVLEQSLPIRLTKTRNPVHSWTNASWNIGVSLSTQEYVAVINSDILLSKNWDRHLITLLQTCTIACPMEKRGETLIKLDPIIESVQPGMILGSCFMFKRTDIHKLLPIPKQLVHYCGDNWLADAASYEDGVKFSSKSVITHAVSGSGRLISREEYHRITFCDVMKYQELSGQDMSLILNVMGGS